MRGPRAYKGAASRRAEGDSDRGLSALLTRAAAPGSAPQVLTPPGPCGWACCPASNDA